MTLAASDVMVHLRRCGVVVHHAARMPGPGSIVVFLEGNLAQFDLAQSCALRLPGVSAVSFAGFSKAIMYVCCSPPEQQSRLRSIAVRRGQGTR